MDFGVAKLESPECLVLIRNDQSPLDPEVTTLSKFLTVLEKIATSSKGEAMGITWDSKNYRFVWYFGWTAKIVTSPPWSVEP